MESCHDNCDGAALSIIVPAFNACFFLDQCLDSVVTQTRGDFEVILINDGSTDATHEKCTEWSHKDSRIRYFSQENCGLGETRNHGIAVSSCGYITFLDADDWWEADYVERMMGAVEALSADVAVCDIWYAERIGASNRKSLSAIRLPANEVIEPASCKSVICKARTFSWGKIYRKSLFVDYKIRQPKHTFEDIPVTPLIVAISKRIVRVDKPLYNYLRNRNGSLANDRRNHKDALLSINELKENFMALELFDQYYCEVRRLAFSQVRFIVRKNGGQDKTLYRESLNTLFRLSPECTGIAKMNFGCVSLGTGLSYVESVADNVSVLKSQISFCEDGSTCDLASLPNVGCIVIGLLSPANPGKKQDLAANLKEIKEYCINRDIYLYAISLEEGCLPLEGDRWDASDELFDALCEMEIVDAE